MNTTDDHLADGVPAYQRSADKHWEKSFRTALQAHNPPHTLADEIVDETRTARAEAGESARELFGPPEEYAQLVAEERISEARRSAVDHAAKIPAGRFKHGAIQVFTTAAGFWFFGWLIFDNVTAEITARLLLGAVLVLSVLIVLVGAFPALRSAGRLRTAAVTIGCAVFCLAAGIAAIALFVPSGLLIVSLHPVTTASVLFALAVLITLLPEERVEHWFRLSAAEELSNEEWLRRLDSLLRGRHGIPRRSANNHVAEAKDHLSSATASAEAAFGPAEDYARSLAQNTTASQFRPRVRIAANTVLSVFCVYYAVEYAFGPDVRPLSTVVLSVVVVMLTSISINKWREIRDADRRWVA